MIDIKKLATSNTKIVEFSKGSVICRDGDPSNKCMYILAKGQVSVFKNYKQAGEISIATLNVGDFFGEMSLFLSKARSATLVARSDCAAYIIDANSVFEFLRANPDATFSLLQAFCSRIDSTSASAAYNSTMYKYELAALNNELIDLENSANIDVLTGAYNRRFFLENADAMLRVGERIQSCSFVVMFDINKFKQMNDTYGHKVGDAMLVEFVRRVSSQVRISDIFARYGGEEFTLLLSYVCAKEVVIILNKIRAAVFDTPIEYEGIEVDLSVSVGLSAISHGEDVQEAIFRAGRSLQKSKEENLHRIEINSEGMECLQANCERNKLDNCCSKAD